MKNLDYLEGLLNGLKIKTRDEFGLWLSPYCLFSNIAEFWSKIDEDNQEKIANLIIGEDVK